MTRYLVRSLDSGPDHEVDLADVPSAVTALHDLGYDEVELVVLPDEEVP